MFLETKTLIVVYKDELMLNQLKLLVSVWSSKITRYLKKH